ncbi:DnaB-like helicase N-terminal domain-containing protein, partial [Escherichia sp. R-CC3]
MQAEPRERDPQVAGLKVPPHSIEAEQSVLGGLMLDNERWDDVAERVVADDFYTRPHRHIFTEMAYFLTALPDKQNHRRYRVAPGVPAI